MSTNQYQILINRQQEEFNKFPIKFAFNDAQLYILQNDILNHFNLSIRNKFIVSTITVYLTIISISLLKKIIRDGLEKIKKM